MFGFSLAYFLVILDTTVLTIALPDLRASLGGSLAGQQWAVNAYTVAFAACLLTGGAVADRYGAARIFKLGVASFGVISLLSAAAPDLGVLIGLRALLGVAGALCTGGSLGLLAELFPEPAARAAPPACGRPSPAARSRPALIGGLLVDLYGWRAVFLLNPPIALISLLAMRKVVSPRGSRVIDWWVQILACAFLGLVAEALIGSAPVAALLSLALLAGLVLAERRSHAPALPGGLLAATWPELLAGTAANFAFSGALFVLTLLLQDTRHLSPMATGLAFLPLTLPMTVNPLLTGRLVARYGPRPPILGGLALIAAGLAGTALTGVLTPWLVVLGFGLSFVLPALMAGMINSAPPGTAGTAGGVLNAFRQVGATLGVAVMGVIGRPLLVAAVLAALTCAGYALAARRARHRLTG
ncbi:MFS transporter [Nonomuraea rubra]|uniref:MFS transporter n=1 Tax=Nonomuraea rubra TaxID=46180 RepID=UPI00360EED3F